MLIVLCGAAGVVGSGALVAVLMQRGQRLAEAEFRLASERQVEQVRWTADDIVTSVLVLRAFFAGSEVVEPDEFRVFTDTLPQSLPSGVRFGWAPRTDGLAGGESYLVEYATEAGPPVSGVGWDLLAEPACREAIERATAAGATVASAPFLSSIDGSPLVLLASPLENGQLRGMVFGVFAPAAVLELAMFRQNTETMVIDVFDAAAAAPRVLVARHGGADAGGTELKATGMAERWSAGSSFLVCGRTWAVETRPAGSLAVHNAWLPWAAGAAGLLLTAAGMCILILLSIQTTRVERLVAARTAEVQQSEEQLRSITNAALDAVVMMAPDGVIAHWNPAAERILGHRRSEVMGRPVHEVLAPEEYRERAAEALRRFSATGEGEAIGTTQEVVALRKDGTRCPVEVSLGAVAMGDGWGAVAVLRDVTERIAARESLLNEQKLLRQLLEFQERERKLIAYEIHDGLVQQLTGALMTFQSLPQAPGGEDSSARDRFEAASGLLRDAIAEARRLISGLRPPVLDESGLGPAVTILVDQQNRRGGPRVALDSDLGDCRLTPLVETAAFRIVQEGLSNACRHSRAERVDVELHSDGKRLNVMVQDSGKGFDPDQVGADHFGLQGIRERARLLGGTAEVRSAPGKGTTVRVTLPVETPSGNCSA